MASSDDRNTLYDAGSIWKFLDNLALSNPEEYKRYIDKIMKEGSELDLGPPVAKFVVQTEKTPQVIPVRKYFVNIGEWKQVPKPESKSSPIPILAAEMRKELVDKEWAMLVDVVLNPVIFINVHNELEKCPIVELVLKYIEGKNGINLSRKYKLLDNKYKGNQDHLLNFMCPTSLKTTLNNTVNGKLTRESMIDQMKHLSKKENHVHDADIKQDKVSVNVNGNGMADENHGVPNIGKIDPIITANLCSPKLTVANTKAIKNVEKNKLKTPKVEMEVNKEKGNMELTVYLPQVESVQECDLELSEKCLSLIVFDKYELQLDLPVCINIEESKAKFVKDLNILVITANLNVTSEIS